MPNFIELLAAGLTGAATRDPLAYARFKAAREEQGLQNLYRKFMMDRMANEDARGQEERERLNRPVSSLVSPEMRTPPPSMMPQEPPGMGRMMPAPDTLADIPYMEGGQARTARVPQMGRGMVERPPMSDMVGGMPMPTGRMTPAPGLTLRDLPAAARAIELMKGPEEETPEYKGAAWGTYNPRTGQPVYERPTAEQGAKGAAWGTFDPRTGKPIYERPEKPPTPKGLQDIQEDLGDKVRYGTFNPETGERKFGPWQKKAASPTQPKNTPEDREQELMESFRKYNDVRLRAPSDPIRLQMIAAMKQMGIDVPVSLPEMTFDQYKQFVTTGKMPTATPEAGKEDPKKLNTLPTGSRKVGTYKGKTVYETPDGKRFVEE